MGILKLAAWELESWDWCNEASAVARGVFLMTGASTVSEQHQPSLRWCWCFSKLCCVCVINSQSRIFPWFIYFLSPLFWNLNGADTEINGSPMIHLSEPQPMRASRQASSGNKRLNLHIINDNGIHTARDIGTQDDQEMSGVVLSARDRLVFADPDKCSWH